MALYDFQQRAVDAACAHFDQDYTRVLCADEAGLGKTHVARGVLERLATEKLTEEAKKDNGGKTLQGWWNAFCQTNANAFNCAQTMKENRWGMVHDFLCCLDKESVWDSCLKKGTGNNYGGLMAKLRGIDWWKRYGKGKTQEDWVNFYISFVKGLQHLFVAENGGKRQTNWEFTMPTQRLPVEPFRALYVCCNLDIAAQNTTRLVPARQNCNRGKQDIVIGKKFVKGKEEDDIVTIDDRPDRLSVLWYYIENYPTPYLEIMPITATLMMNDTEGNMNERVKLKERFKLPIDIKNNMFTPEERKLTPEQRKLGEDETYRVYHPDLLIFDEFQNFGEIMHLANGQSIEFEEQKRLKQGDLDKATRTALQKQLKDKQDGLKRIQHFCQQYISKPGRDAAKLLMLSATPFHRLPQASDLSQADISEKGKTQLTLASIIQFMGGDYAVYQGQPTLADKENYLCDICGIYRTERIRLMGKDNAAYHLLECNGAKLLQFAAYLQAWGGGNVASEAIATTPHQRKVAVAYDKGGTYTLNNRLDNKIDPADHPRYQRLLDVVTADDADDVTEVYDPGRLRQPDMLHKLLWLPPVAPSRALGGVFKQYKHYSKTLVFSNLRMTPESVTELLNAHVSYRPMQLDRAALVNALNDYLRDNGAERFANCAGFAGVLADYLLRVGGSVFPIPSVAMVIRYCEDGCLADVLNEFAALQENSQIKDKEKLKAYQVKAVKEALNNKPLYHKLAVAMDNTNTSDCRTAFNTPFLPFVLMTTSIGTEGLDFHLYCNRLAHYTLPQSVVELEQKNGRIDRRRSLAQRRWWAAPGAKFRLDHHKDEMYDRSGGLVPDWDAGENQLHYYFFYEEYSHEHDELDALFEEQRTYRHALGVNKELVPDLLDLSPYSRSKKQ